MQHRRTRRDFSHSDARAVFGRDGCNPRADPLGDVVALRLALALGHKVDLQVRNVSATTHEIVSHQAVEVERRGDTRINLIVRHFRLDPNSGSDLAGSLGCLLQRTAFGHVKNNLKLALVVERQHLHFYKADAH